jgi:hypothetical protein
MTDQLSSASNPRLFEVGMAMLVSPAGYGACNVARPLPLRVPGPQMPVLPSDMPCKRGEQLTTELQTAMDDHAYWLREQGADAEVRAAETLARQQVSNAERSEHLQTCAECQRDAKQHVPPTRSANQSAES